MCILRLSITFQAKFASFCGADVKRKILLLLWHIAKRFEAVVFTSWYLEVLLGMVAPLVVGLRKGMVAGAQGFRDSLGNRSVLLSWLFVGICI